MAASVEFRPHNRDLGVLTRDVDEDLAIYLGLRNEITAVDSFLLPSEQPRTVDNEWLIAEPDHSVLPSLENKELRQVVKSEPANNTSEEESASSPSKPKSSSSSAAADNAASNKRPLSSSSRSQKPHSRSSTPTVIRRQVLPSKPKSSTPSSRSSLPSLSKSKADQTSVAKPSSITKSSSRSSTPTRKISQGQKVVSTAACRSPMSSSSSSSSGVGSSEAVKPKPSKSRDLISLPHNAVVQNPKATVPNKRPVSASQGRSSPANSTLSSKLLRPKSCSPAKARAPNIASGGNKTVIFSRTRGQGNNGVGGDVNPVLMGTKMVERVVNMRRLAPPKQDHDECVENKPKAKRDNSSSGFGRSLSSKSLDMAIRHMDIRRSNPENLRPVATSGVKPRTTAKVCDVVDVTESSSSSGNDGSPPYGV